MQIVVRWKSKVDPKALLDGARFPGFELTVSGDDAKSPPDIAVLDARFFSTDDLFEAALLAAGAMPKLLIVDGPEIELTLIRGGLAKSLDEFCHIHRIDEELTLRILRLLGRVGTRRNSFAIDSLTGVMTRQGFLAHAGPLLASASEEQPISALMIDIDHFKKVNDEFGHQAGDQVLRRIGEVLERSARGVECIARIGGDEFVVLVRAAMRQAAGLGEFLRHEVEQEQFEDGIRVSISVGVDTTTAPTPEEQLVSGADICLYRAKANGRNRVVTGDTLQRNEEGSEQDVDFFDFETRIQVITERFGEELALRGKRMAKRYREESERDGLTGLYNRRYLDKRLPREMENAVRHGRKLSFILLDLDHFGEVNRTFGFPGGDRVLRLLASVLRANTRTVDWVARYGGEEFCVVMPDTPLSEGLVIADRLRTATKKEATQAVDGREIRVTASMGVVELDGNGATDMDVFIQAASDKVREAKRGGRDQVCPGPVALNERDMTTS